jgi:hypothetical protein
MTSYEPGMNPWVDGSFSTSNTENSAEIPVSSKSASPLGRKDDERSV